jgi:hypothetical protein
VRRRHHNIQIIMRPCLRAEQRVNAPPAIEPNYHFIL